MTRYRDWDWFPKTPPLPPPARGIKVKQLGSTWWGARWIGALDAMAGEYSSRLSRGRTYARAGRVHDLVVTAGQVKAKVTGSAPKPYVVTVQLWKHDAATWKKAIVAMTAQAQFAAELLASRMPQDIDEVFRASGASLFPAHEADLSTECTCPDYMNPCKHVAATHYVLGEALDRDPFLLFELRGRTKDQVLAALRAARSGGRSAKRVAPAEPEIPTTSLAATTSADYDRARAPLPVLHLSFEEPAATSAVLRQLGAPAGWSGPRSPADVLAPVIRSAAAEARRIAIAEPAPSVPPPTPASRATRRRK